MSDHPFDEDAKADAFFGDLLDAVRQQIDSPDTRYVSDAFSRLIRLGMEEDDALEAIARCLAVETDKVLRKHAQFDTRAYQQALAELSPEGT